MSCPDSGFRSRNAVVTIFNVEKAAAMEVFSNWKQVQYCSVGAEVCSSTNRPHLQCYFEFANSMRYTVFCNRIGVDACFFTKRKGDVESAIGYTQKGEQSHEEWKSLGTSGPNYGQNADFSTKGVPSDQGSREDLKAVIADIKEGSGLRQIFEDHIEVSAKYLKWVTTAIDLFAPSNVKAKYSLDQCCAKLNEMPVPFDDPDWEHVAVIEGNPGSGKTQFALSHFENPLFVRHPDRLKSFDPTFHDGIVFDDMEFHHWPTTAQVHVCDWNDPADIHCRYANAHIPRGTKKIFVCNSFPFKFATAITDRIYHVVCDPSLGSQRKKFKQLVRPSYDF